MEIKKIVNFSMLLALSIVLSIIESFIPIFNGSIPGIKIGLANIVIVYALYNYKFIDVLSLTILRVILVGLLRTGLLSINFFLSLTGAIFSAIMMWIMKKTRLSIIGISVIGSVFHVMGQVVMAIILLNNINVIYYFPYLVIFSIVTGIIIGIISKSVIEKTKNII